MVVRFPLLLVVFIIAAAAAIIFLALGDNPARAVLGEAHSVDHRGVAVQYYINAPISTDVGADIGVNVETDTVVFLASYARSGSDFNELVSVLNRAGYHTLVLQARGVGGSELPALDLTLFDYAGDLKSVLDQERIAAPITLVGHAFGNRIARAFASRFPDRVRSLVLLAAGDGAPPPAVRNDIFKILLGFWPESGRRDALRRAFFAGDNSVPAHWLNGWYPRAGLAQGRATANTPLSQWMGGGGVPMLVVQPTEDAAAAEGGGKLRRRYADRVTLLHLEGAGHAVLPEQPEAVSRILLEHLEAY